MQIKKERPDIIAEPSLKNGPGQQAGRAKAAAGFRSPQRFAPDARSGRAGRVSAVAAALLAVSTFVIAGCNTGDSARAQAREAELEALRERAEQTPSIPAPPTLPPSLAEDEPAEDPDIPEPILDQPLPRVPIKNFNMGRESDLATVLRALARGADVNLVLGSGVSGPIRLSLPGETRWDRLFEMIVETHGLHYDFRDGILRVMAEEDVGRQIALERALKEREIAKEERQRAEPAGLELYRVRYAEAERLAESLRTTLASTAEQTNGTINIIPDSDSGLLVFHASPSQMPSILRLARSLDQPAHQILIEATIVQTNSETARELGMQWGVTHTAPDGGQVAIGTGVHPDGFNANFPAGFDSTDTGFAFGVERLSGNQLLQAQLTALQRDGRLSIISSPSITTLDKQTALIESGEERPFQSATGAGAAATPVVEFKQALLTLEVTPQVIDGEWIKLLIRTTKDDFDDSRPIPIAGTIQVPIMTRRANTTLYLSDGQTTVIGGLSTDTESSQVEGIPILKDLPLLGGLFRNSRQRAAFNDTLIFITPRILPGGIAGREAVEELRDENEPEEEPQ